MDRKALILLAAFALAVLIYVYYPPLAVVTQTVTGTIVLKPCPLDPTVNVYALETADGTVYYLIYGTDGYVPEGNPNVNPWLREHLGKTVTLRGEVVTVHGQLSLRNPMVV